jgi:polar amino acid transport system substrate-binding protein
VGVLLEQCDRLLEQIIPAIVALEEGAAAVPAKSAPLVDKAALMPLLTRLRTLLQEDDMEAGEVLSALLEQAGGSEFGRPLRAIENALGEYDFQLALTLLEPLIAPASPTPAGS